MSRDLGALRALNLGCGRDIRPDCVNLDVAALPGVDIVHDLAALPLPFAADRFDRIVCQDVLEHVDLIATLRELHRITAPGGRLDIRVPHFTSANSWADPTHLRAFALETFDPFCAGSARGYYFDFHYSAIARRRITFCQGPAYALNALIAPLVNMSIHMQRYYERSALRLFPAVNIEVRLIK